MSAREPALDTLGAVARELGNSSTAEEVQALAERLREGSFFVACVGQFKRGKSTLLNALVGDPVLPVGVAPVTSCVTILRHGATRSARVRFADARTEDVAVEEIAAFVSEDRNPENRKGVRAVEVYLPAPLLSGGMCLVDTPGIGSVFEGNSAVTREFVPHVDAALVVLGADPPISGQELELVRQLSTHVTNLLFVLNKSDRLPEADRAQALAFTRRVLGDELELPTGRILGRGGDAGPVARHRPACSRGPLRPRRAAVRPAGWSGGRRARTTVPARHSPAETPKAGPAPKAVQSTPRRELDTRSPTPFAVARVP